ncbi:MAG: MBOAT family protein, partial [Lachnospiraceae bacterium]|nr:MBOAT family protein [Lachnospiraceae bacterium]
MVFNSIQFIILFPLAVLIYYLIPKKFRYVWLLACSYAFYYVNSGALAALLAICTVITYIAGMALSVTDSKAGKKAVLAGAASAVLLVLFVFKYLDFSLSLFGSGLRFNLTLPLGISFYTFMAVSYMADVYSGKIEAQHNILKLALYLSFFLSILSGPINRAGDMLPQFSDAKSPSIENLKTGMQKMLWGYFLKLAIAGRLAIVTENVYSDADAYSGVSIAFAAIAYLFMLYCDFEGYSQIAIGCAKMLGIKMKENFRQPFLSKSMSELWRRWHISLSSWLRDYLYIPLGGNRRGTFRKYLNIFIVLLISGIWHGANMTFIIWGVLNGVFMIAG